MLSPGSPGGLSHRQSGYLQIPGPCIPPALSQPTGGVNNKEPRGLLMARIGESEAGRGEIPSSPRSMRTSLQNPVCNPGLPAPYGSQPPAVFYDLEPPTWMCSQTQLLGPTRKDAEDTVLTASFFQHIVTFCWPDALSLAWWTCCALVLWLSHCHP